MKHYVGLDVSLAETAICVVDENGVIIREGFAASEPEDITAWLAKLDLAFERVGLEAGAMASWLYTELRARGLPAICIDPRHLRGLTKTIPVKNDRNDARAIAHCMRVGWFSVVHVKSAVSQELRMLLVNRKTLLTKQIDLENEIRGTLRVFGLKLAGRVTQASFQRRGFGAARRPASPRGDGTADAYGAHGAPAAMRGASSDGADFGPYLCHLSTADDDPRRRHDHRGNLSHHNR